ncbi:MAG: hypothetical protein L6416_04225 [Candidatus Omnitrophica bacterium]|nr:hypothetical protein [Candidatus Omnitrophota bacterium]
MLLSSRNKFSSGSKKWSQYINWVNLKNIKEIRSIDAELNQYVEHCGDYECSYEDLNEVKECLPKPSKNQYYLLAIEMRSGVNTSNEDLENFYFLGYDLADSTCTSSILNCGELKGNLAIFKEKLNKYGLLNLEDAKMLKDMLPRCWGQEEPHAKVNIWGLYEVPTERGSPH